MTSVGCYTIGETIGEVITAIDHTTSIYTN
jgi:hypothetical protein